YPGYRSTRLRAPKRPLVTSPEELHSLLGPVFGDDALDPTDGDLTAQHEGEPLGERIVVSGRVLDEDGRPVPGARVEVWQADATATRSTSTRRRSTRTSQVPAGCSLTTAATIASSRSSRAPIRGATTRTRGARRTSTSRSSAARSRSGSSRRCTSPATRCSH